LEGVLRLILPQGFELWRFVVYPVMLLLIMLLKSNGLFGDYEMPYLRQLIPPLKKKYDKSAKTSATPPGGNTAVQEASE